VKEDYKIPFLLGMVAQVCNPRNWEAEAGGSQVQGQPELHSEFQAKLDYIK
jgi:hypothetical protein